MEKNNYLIDFSQLNCEKDHPLLAKEISIADDITCSSIDDMFFYVIIKPEFYEVGNWEALLGEFETHFHSIYKEHAEPIFKNYVSGSAIKDILKFRSSNSIHHKFGMPAACIENKLNSLGISILRNRGRTFWREYEKGNLGITDTELKRIIATSLLAPSPMESSCDFYVYQDEIPASYRAAWVDWKNTIKLFNNPIEFIEFMVNMNRAGSPIFKQGTMLTREQCAKIQKSFPTRCLGFKNAKALAGLRQATFQLLSFLYKKGLIVIPTTHNNTELISAFKPTLKENIKTIENLDQVRISSGVTGITKYSRSINDPTEASASALGLFLQGKNNYYENHLKSVSVPLNKHSTQETTEETTNLEDKNRKQRRTKRFYKNSISKRPSELSVDESLLFISSKSRDGVSVFSTTSRGENDRIFNRSSYLVLLDRFFEIEDYSLLIKDFKEWMDKYIANNVEVSNIILETIPTERKELISFINNLNHEEVTGYDLSSKGLIFSELFPVFLWSRHLALMPSFGSSIGQRFPIDLLISDFNSIITTTASQIKENSFYTPNPKKTGQKNRNVNLYKRINSVFFALKRTLLASTPTKLFKDISQAQLELIFMYGGNDYSNSHKSEYRTVVKGIAKILSDLDLSINTIHLSSNSIRQRLPSSKTVDPFHIWTEKGFYIWHDWLTRLLDSNARRMNKLDVIRHINNTLLAFIEEFGERNNCTPPQSPFEMTPRMIVAESPNQYDLKKHIDGLGIKDRHGAFSRAVVPLIELPISFPDEAKELGYTQCVPSRNPFKSNKRNSTHRYPIESLHLDIIKEVLFEFDNEGRPTFSWVKSYYSKIDQNTNNSRTRDVFIDNHGNTVWWPGTAVCLGFLLEVPLRGFQARWLDQGNLDDSIYNSTTKKYSPNKNQVGIKYPDGSSHQKKFEKFGGRSGVLQGQNLSFMSSNEDEDEGSRIAPAIFVNTNKTSISDNRFDQGYYIPWPCEEGTDLPYWLLNYMVEFNKRYDPTPTPINMAFEQEKKRVNKSVYSPTKDSEAINSHPWVTPLFRDITRHPDYSVKSDFSFDGDGNVVIPPVSQQKLYSLFSAVIEEAERRLIERNYPPEIASMRHANGDIKYDIHTLRVTGVSRLIALGVPIEVVRDVVGHAVETMTYYYTIIDQLKILDHLKKGKKIELDRLSKEQQAIMNSLIFANVGADPQAAVSYGGWVERNGGVCPSALCEEGGLPDMDEDGNIMRFNPVPGGPFRCGNCRHWLTGPKYLVEQVHYADLLMKKLIDSHRDRCDLYERLTDVEVLIEDNPSQGILSEHSTLQSEIHQLTEQIACLWMEWRNRYYLLEQSIESFDKYSDEIADGKMVILGANTDPLDLNIERHTGSEFGVKRAISHALALPIQINQDHKSVLNEMERDLTKLQLMMDRSGGSPPVLSQIIDDNLRNRSVAVAAQSLFIQFGANGINGDKTVDKLLKAIKTGIVELSKDEKNVLTTWKKDIEQHIGKDMIPSQEIPVLLVDDAEDSE